MPLAFRHHNVREASFELHPDIRAASEGRKRDYRGNGGAVLCSATPYTTTTNTLRTLELARRALTLQVGCQAGQLKTDNLMNWKFAG